MRGYKVVDRYNRGPVRPTLDYHVGKTVTVDLSPEEVHDAKSPNIECGPGINIFSSIKKAKRFVKEDLTYDYKYKLLVVEYKNEDVFIKLEDKIRLSKVRVVRCFGTISKNKYQTVKLVKSKKKIKRK